MLPLCASLLAHPMKPSCSIEQGGVTQPHSYGNITGAIAKIVYRKVVKKLRQFISYHENCIDYKPGLWMNTLHL